MTPAFPTSLPLTGMDWFLLVLDGAMRRRVGHGNVSHLVVSLDGELSAQTLERAVQAVPVLAWLASLRVRRAHPFALPRWVACGPATVRVAERVLDLGQDVQDGFVTTVDPRVDPPLWFELAKGGEAGTHLVLAWHHALLDARGAERLFLALRADAGTPDATTVDLPAAREGTVLSRLLLARTARDFVFRTSLGRIGTMTRRAPARGAPLTWRRAVFTPEETVRLRARGVEVGAGLFRSALLVAAIGRGLDRVVAERGEPARDLLVPMPRDNRRGRDAPVVGNDLSVLFYRLTPEDRRTLASSTQALITQMRALASAKMAEAFVVLLEMCRFLPERLLLGLIALPSLGRVATFGFSDTGETLDLLRSVCGLTVGDACHYPANIHPPGLTFVVSGRAGSLQFTTAWLEGTLTEAEYDAVMAHVRSDLVGA